MIVIQHAARLASIVGLVLALAGCGLAAGTTTPVVAGGAMDAPVELATLTPGASPAPAVGVGPIPSESVFFGYTYQQPDGNRLIAGQGVLPEAAPVDIPLEASPLWLVAAPFKDGSLWAAVLVDGRVQAFRAGPGGQWAEEAITPAQLPPGMPPILRVQGDEATLLPPPMDAPSLLTHPVVLTDTGRLAFIHADGRLMIRDGKKLTWLEVNALPDARLLQDETRRLLLLTDPTTRYSHGVLGDQVEAAGMTLIETGSTLAAEPVILLQKPDVIEGIAPIWTDLSGDSKRELVITLSNEDQGAQVVVFNQTGERIAAGPAIGHGYRWRHQIAVAAFGPDGVLELVGVRTPHIGGVVEFYRLEGNQLTIVAEMPGYTSHVIGSRNLDMAAAGDFDGDGQIELLLPTQSRMAFGAIQRTEAGATVDWSTSLPAKLTTNLAAVTLPGGQMAVGVGLEDGTLRLWLPE